MVYDTHISSAKKTPNVHYVICMSGVMEELAFQEKKSVDQLPNHVHNLSLESTSPIFEPPGGKTNNVVSEQVRHKPACTSTEKR